MRAAKKSVDNIKILQDFIPLNALSDERFNELAEKIVIEVVRAGRDLFRRGDRDNRAIYLLEGKVSLSVGVALLGPDTDAEALIRTADLAMYAAKKAGGARIVVRRPS